MVDEMKEELKRLRSRMNSAINSACLDFEQCMVRGSANSQGNETSEFDRYYDCCQQLVEYISKTMDTSPDFVRQMNDVILASRSNTNQDMLESVLKHDVWFQRRGAASKRKKTSAKDFRFEMATNRPGTSQILGKRKHKPRTKDDTENFHFDPHKSEGASFEEELLQNGVDELNRCKDENKKVESTFKTAESQHQVTTKKFQQRNEQSVIHLCLMKPQEPGQLEIINRFIHDTNKMVDAQFCDPPEGYLCSRGCAKMREEMNTESALRCILQSIGAHLDECQSPQCELKIRVELRKIPHLVEMKQLDSCKIRRKLRDIKLNSMTDEDEVGGVRYPQLCKSEIELLERSLRTNKEDLVVLEKKKASLCAVMDSIRLDWRDEVVESAQTLHYVHEA